MSIKLKLLDSKCLGLNKDCTIVCKDNVNLYYVYSWNMIFKLLDIKISFNGNSSSSGSVSDVDANVTEKWTCPSCSFTKTGYEFNGYWTSNADGTGDKYYPGLKYSSYKSITLYASWKEVENKVMFIFSIGYGLTKACYSLDVKRIYNFVKAQKTNKNLDVTYHLMNYVNCNTNEGYKINTKGESLDGIEYEWASLANFKKNFKEGLSSKNLVIVVLSGHGGSGSIWAFLSESISGTVLANMIKENTSNPNVRVLFIFDCCNAGGVAPFKLANGILNSTNGNDVESNYGIDDELFSCLDENNNDINDNKLYLANSLKSSSGTPKVMSWCAIPEGVSSRMDSNGSTFLYEISERISIKLTYYTAWNNKGGIKDIKQFNSSPVKKNKNFDETIAIFT